MKQETFTDIEYSCRKKKTKRKEFLEIMDEIIPWEEWVGMIAPYYPQGKRGRPPVGIVSAPVIKCKKKVGKKCNDMAERREKR